MAHYQRLPTGAEDDVSRQPLDRFQIDDRGAFRLRRWSSRRVFLLAGAACLFLVLLVLAHAVWRRAPQVAVAACSMFMVRSFDSYTGFGSEYGIYLRAAALSPRVGWTVVPDTRNWIYGELSEYFVPPKHSCAPPNDLLEKQSSYHVFGTQGWENQTRLQLTRGFNELIMLERLIRDNSINTTMTAELMIKQKLWSMDIDRLTLPYGDSVPEGVVPAFVDQARALEQLWVPTPRMQAQIDRLVERVELKERDITKRRPVVVVQIRLGDKRTEQEDLLKVGTHMKFDDMSIYFRAVELAVARLYEPDITPKAFPRPIDGHAKPLVVVMTAELNVTEQLAALDVQHKYDFVLSPSEEFTPEEQREYDTIIMHKNQTASAVRRWDQKDLEATSLGLRVAMTRQLIAEMTVYSRYADAFIVSGNSNLGRLAQALAGEEGALGPPDRRVLGGRVRSIDVPFYPTTWRHMIYPGA